MPNNTIPLELKKQALVKLLPHYSCSLRQVAKEIGVAYGTVFKWRKQLENDGVLMPNNNESQ